MFLDTPNFKAHEELINDIVFYTSQSVSDMKADISQSHQFHGVPDFITGIAQQKQYRSLGHERYAITIPKKWYHITPSIITVKKFLDEIIGFPIKRASFNFRKLLR